MKKGFSLIVAILTVLILTIIATGFISIANFSSDTTTRNAEDMRMYWVAESASNYNINWWINLPDSTRKIWNSDYVLTTTASKGKGNTTIYKDTDLESFDVSNMPEMKDKIAGSTIWLHASTKEKPNILQIDGKQVIQMRYKAPRKDKPSQAVWVLDSYGYDSNTGTLSEILISNVYNYISINDIGWLDYAEALNHTMYGAGINSRKGVYYEWDFRYGQCYFNDLVRFDFKSGSSKKGPTFYGKYHTASKDASRYGTSVASPTLFSNLTSNYAYGLFGEFNGSDKINTQAKAITKLGTSLLGGYERVDEMPTEGVVWSWADVVKYGPTNGIYFLPKDKFSAGEAIRIETKVTMLSGKPVTYIDIFKGTNNVPTIKDLPASQWNSVAIEKIYGDVSIKGVSNSDFTLVTESNNINIVGDFYLYEMAGVKQTLENSPNTSLEAPSRTLMEGLYNQMLAIDPQGHLALISCLGDRDNTTSSKRENSFFLTKEETIFMNAALLSYNGDVGAAGGVGTSQNSGLNFYNIGSVIILDQQQETTGTNSAKYPYALVQDARFLDPEEPIPPVFGEGPASHTAESTKGLNPNHGWNRYSYSGINEIEEITERFIK